MILGERSNARCLNLHRDTPASVADRLMRRIISGRRAMALMVTPGGSVIIAEPSEVPDDARKLVGVYAKGVGENQIADDVAEWARENGVVCAEASVE